MDGEGVLVCPEAQEWFDGVKTHCVKIEAEQHFRHGKIEVRHRIVEEDSAKATGKEERNTVWEAHFGVKPRLDQYLLGPFGRLTFLLLSEEQRR